jgi:alpha-glucosidase
VHDNYTPREAYYYIALLHTGEEAGKGAMPLASVSLDGKEAPFVEGGLAALKTSAPDSWAYDRDAGISYIKVEDNKTERHIKGGMRCR